MRNTAQFPITRDEMLAAIDDALGLMPPRGIGDIRPVALREVRKIIAAGDRSPKGQDAQRLDAKHESPIGEAEPSRS